MRSRLARIVHLIAVAALLLTATADCLQARRERLGLRHVALDLPGPPSKVIPRDLDGDGRSMNRTSAANWSTGLRRS